MIATRYLDRVQLDEIRLELESAMNELQRATLDEAYAAFEAPVQSSIEARKVISQLYLPPWSRT
jgi:hypothetical protein